MDQAEAIASVVGGFSDSTPSYRQRSFYSRVRPNGNVHLQSCHWSLSSTEGHLWNYVRPLSNSVDIVLRTRNPVNLVMRGVRWGGSPFLNEPVFNIPESFVKQSPESTKYATNPREGSTLQEQIREAARRETPNSITPINDNSNSPTCPIKAIITKKFEYFWVCIQVSNIFSNN